MHESIPERLELENSPRTEISDKRARNGARLVNRIPHELLLRIFMIGEEMQRSKRLKVTEAYPHFPLTITQVCSQWRHVAINSPLLWTYIHINRPPPHEIAMLYLRRSGTDTLLELDIEMRSSYWGMMKIDSKDWRRQVEHISGLLAVLTATGAGIRRWKSLIICVKTPQTFFELVRILNTESAPALRFLSCLWKTGMSARRRMEEPRSLSDPRIFGDSYSLSGPLFPNLRSVELNAIPWGFVLNRHSLSLFNSLVGLSLTAAFDTKSSVNIYNLLSSNLQLEQLYLNSGMGIDASFEPSISRVHFVGLKLAPIHLHVGHWLDSPESPQITELLGYIATGKLSGNNPSHTDQALPDKPIYPSLHCLEVSSVLGRREAFKTLFSALSSVNRLTITSGALDLLGQSPWLLPNLVYLGFPNSTPYQLGNVLRRRLEAGFPVETVELALYGREEIAGGLPDTVTVVDAPIPEFTLNLYETDEDDPNDWDY